MMFPVKSACRAVQGLGIVVLCPFIHAGSSRRVSGVLVASRAWWRAGGCDAGVPGRFGGSRWRADRGCQAIWLWAVRALQAHPVKCAEWAGVASMLGSGRRGGMHGKRAEQDGDVCGRV